MAGGVHWSAFLITPNTLTAVCHCFAEAVRGASDWRGTACAKQWHIVVRNAVMDKT
jgi:hypothetical protein